MTPFELEILMHHYVTPVHFSRPSDAYEREIARFMEDGILDISVDDADSYIVTDKGKAWISEILSTPIPVQAWIGATGKVIQYD